MNVAYFIEKNLAVLNSPIDNEGSGQERFYSIASHLAPFLWETLPNMFVSGQNSTFKFGLYEGLPSVGFPIYFPDYNW